MKTSNFANNARYDLRGISISRYPDKRSGFTGPEFTPFMPSERLLKAYKEGLPWPGYAAVFQQQLDCLNPQKTWERLMRMAEAIGADEPILLCYESAKTLDTNPCHRRLVAQWFKETIGEDVPEWSKDLQGSLL